MITVRPTAIHGVNEHGEECFQLEAMGNAYCLSLASTYFSPEDWDAMSKAVAEGMRLMAGLEQPQGNTHAAPLGTERERGTTSI